MPDEILNAWRDAGTRSAAVREEWEGRLAASSASKAEFERRIAGDLPAGFGAAMAAHKKKLAEDKPKVATRKASRDGARSRSTACCRRRSAARPT